MNKQSEASLEQLNRKKGEAGGMPALERGVQKRGVFHIFGLKTTQKAPRGSSDFQTAFKVAKNLRMAQILKDFQLLLV